MKELVYKNWLFWRGRAGAYAKNKNDKLEFCNSQKLRYFNKYAILAGLPGENINTLIKERFI